MAPVGSSPQQRADYANDNDCDIFVSIHCNAVVDPNCPHNPHPSPFNFIMLNIH